MESTNTHEKGIALNKIILIILFIITFLLAAKMALAATIEYSQPDQSVQLSNRQTTFGQGEICFPTGIYVSDLRASLNDSYWSTLMDTSNYSSTTPTGGFYINFYAMATSSNSRDCQTLINGGTANAVDQWLYSILNGTPGNKQEFNSLMSNKSNYASSTPHGSGYLVVHMLNSSNGTAYAWNNAWWSYSNTLTSDPYFFFGEIPQPDTTSPPFITSVSPNNISTTTNSFSFTTNGFAYSTSTINWILQNRDTSYFYEVRYDVIPASNTLTNDFTISTSTIYYSLQDPSGSCGIIPGSGCSTPVATTTLADGSYTGYATIIDNLGQRNIPNFPINFVIGNTIYGEQYPPSSGIILPGTDFTAPTSTTGLSSTNLLGFLNVPNLLRTKFPFAYMPEIYSAYIVGIGTTTQAAAMPNGTMNFPWPSRWHLGSISTTTIQIDSFSTTTITYYLPNPTLSLVRNVLVAMLYWNMISFLWHDIRRRHHLIK